MLDEKKARGLMNDEEYIANELAAINLEWKEQKVNDIESNPVGCWYTIGECGTVRRFYKIVPMSKCDTRGMVTDENHYFCLYEACGIESDNVSLVAIYESLDDAKERAKMQLLVINNIIKTYCPQND